MSARAWILTAISLVALPVSSVNAATGVLRVTSIPSRAEIWIDGVFDAAGIVTIDGGSAPFSGAATS